MTCFFDPTHGPGVQNILWAPQWGAVRNIQTCVACAQRWAMMQQQQAAAHGAPPPPAPGYPAPQQPYGYQPGYAQSAPGYPQPGYGPGYVQQPAYGHGYGYDHEYEQPHRQGPGWGGVAAAGAAGLIGGALINEMLDDDEPQQVVHQDITNIVEDNEYVDYNDYSSDSPGSDDNWS